MVKSTIEHPRPLERNASILWARDLVDRPEQWVVCAIEPGNFGTPVSVAVLSGRSALLIEGKAPLSEDFKRQLQNVLADKEVVFWDGPLQTRLLAGLSAVSTPTHCLLKEYSRFVGELDGAVYKSQELKIVQHNGSTLSSAVARTVLDNIRRMAATSLTLDAADTGNPRWTAAHYKPKLSPADKLRLMFGLD